MSMPYTESQRPTAVSDTSSDARKGSLQVNNLVYTQPSSLTTTVSRTSKISYFQRADYKQGETLILDINSGTDFIRPYSSFLSFILAPTTSGASIPCNFGSGSALNCIEEITIRTRGGVELDRMDGVNLYQRMSNAFTHTEDWFQSVGSGMGYGIARDGLTDGATLSNVIYEKYNIPLSQLCGFFRPVNKTQYIPASLASGLHIEIRLAANAGTVFFNKGAVAADLSGYTLTEARMVLDSCALSEDTQRTLNLQSANAGLEYSYPRVYTSRLSQAGTQRNVNIQVRKSVSQCEGAFTIAVRDDRFTDFDEESLNSVFAATQWQNRIGNIYYPNSRTGTILDSHSTAYSDMLTLFNKNRAMGIQPPATSKQQFANTYGAVPGSFVKSQELPFSGCPLNNSRSLEVSWENGNDLTGNQTYICFLMYLSVSRSWLSNTAVAI